MGNYTIYKREKKEGLFFYVMFKNPETGKYGSAQSIDGLLKKLGDYSHHVTKRSEAECVVQRAIKHGLGEKKESDPLFSQYVLNFWDYDNSEYVKKKTLKKRAIGKDYVYSMKNTFLKHALPYLPPTLTCTQVKFKHLEEVQRICLGLKRVTDPKTGDLSKVCSVATTSKVMNSMRVPINELLRTHVLIENPLLDLERYPEDSESPIGILTDRETERLIYQMFNDSYYGFEKEVKVTFPGSNGKMARTKTVHTFLDRRVYLATCLSSITGMRKGEVLALRTANIRFPNADDKAEDQAIVDIVEAFARRQGFKCPKNRKTRQAPIPRWLADDLVEFASRNPWDNGLVFFSDRSPENPMDLKNLTDQFIKELERIGISAEERKERHIVFHSLRHKANTEMRTIIGGERTRLIVGHTSEAMTDYYDSKSDKRIYQIGEQTKDLIPNPHKEEVCNG